MNRFLVFVSVFLFLAQGIRGQIGGNSVYNFLTQLPNARAAALGGNAMTCPENDMALVFNNPGLLTKNMKGQLSSSYMRLFAGMSLGYAGYAWNTKSAGPLAAGIHYMDYGWFDRTDESGNLLGQFTASDYCFHLSNSRIYKNWNIGVSAKLIYSTLESYSSTGVAADIGAAWRSDDSLLLLSALASNVGMQLSSYYGNNTEKLPANLQIGFSKKFAHNPFRFSLIAYNLQNIGRLLYQNPSKNARNIDLVTGEAIPEDFGVLDYAMSHLLVSTEVILGPGLSLRFGYNNLRRRELSLFDVRTMAGFSWGFGIKISKFNISYGSASYYAGNSTNNFSILTNLNDFYKKKKQ